MASVVWRFVDAKPGHRRQTDGLIQALRTHIPLRVYDIPVSRSPANMFAYLTGRFDAGRMLPPPELLLGAGHATHWPMLAARRRWGGRVVVIMKPSLPLAWFDLCLIPAHDRPLDAANVLRTEGAINCIQRSHQHDSSLGLIALGGPSRHFRWCEDSLSAQIAQLTAARSDVSWRLTGSRRTPAAFLRRIERETGFDVMAAEACGPQWWPQQLARAGEVWVSQDSVSMIYEALTSGARVGVLTLAPTKANRLDSAVRDMVERGWLARVGDTDTVEELDCPLDEAARCAAWMVHTWLKSH